MDDDALERIEIDLYQIAEVLGQPEALDNQLYRSRLGDDASERVLSVKDRVKEKLWTLDRLLALHDKTTYDVAMQNFGIAIQSSQRDQKFDTEAPTKAVLIDDASGAEIWSFSELPDLTDARTALKSLISELEL